VKFKKGERGEVSTQTELEAAIKAEALPIVLVADTSFVFDAPGSPYIITEGKCAPHIVARGSSAPRIEARGSSAPRIEAWESSAPRIEAWESSAPRGNIGPFAGLILHRYDQAKSTVTGSNIITIEAPVLKTVEDWCAYYGAPVNARVVVLFKAVRNNYRSSRGFKYAPGTTPEAPDWDGGREECGGGLHFCAHPLAALGFDPDATKFLACPVAVSDIRTPLPGDAYPQKVKARRICAPIYEVDRDGKPLKAKE
jgi:hypothetical protein